MADTPHQCPHCARRPFADRLALYSHVRQSHGQKKARACVPDHPHAIRTAEREAADRQRQRERREREPSMADLHVEACIARAMGEPVDADIAEMFDV
nr:hypothetical protein [Methylobacterium sp. L1A1]